VADRFIKIILVRSEHNISDRFTKNVMSGIYDAHTVDYMAGREANFKKEECSNVKVNEVIVGSK
jgi:hypothetical protein